MCDWFKKYNKKKRFSNLGNTCYMNAILQCLLKIDTFSIDLLKNYEVINSRTKASKQILSLQDRSQQCSLHR